MSELKPKYRVKAIVDSTGIDNYIKYIIQIRWWIFWINYSLPCEFEDKTNRMCDELNQYYYRNKGVKFTC